MGTVENGDVRSKRIIYFSAFILLTLVEVFIAIFVHDNFIRPYIGDVLAVMVVYFFVRIIWPKEGSRLLPRNSTLNTQHSKLGCEAYH
jgi:hypothetical protein